MFHFLKGKSCEKMSRYRIEWLLNETCFSQSTLMETCQEILHKYSVFNEVRHKDYFHLEMIRTVVHIYPEGRVDLELLLVNVCDSNLKNYRFSVLFPLYIRKSEPVYYIVYDEKIQNQVKNDVSRVILSFVQNLDIIQELDRSKFLFDWNFLKYFTLYIKIVQKLYEEYLENNKLVKRVNDLEVLLSKNI